jgi:adenylate cyclase
MSDYANISRKETYPKARKAVQKALEFDPNLAEAHASLASLIMLGDWDWAGAEREFKLAISLNPHYATAHHWYAELLSFQGRIGQALAEASLAEELDPVSPAIIRDKGMILYYARDYDSAIEHAVKASELDQSFALSHRLLSLAYQGKGMFDKAIAENQQWAELVGNGLEASIALAQCYAAAGKNDEALKLVQEVKPDELTSGNLFRGVALVYASLGLTDQAFTWLEGAYERRAEALSTLKIDPKLDRLRADPRFLALLKKVGLES